MEEKKSLDIGHIKWEVGAHTGFVSNLYGTIYESIKCGMTVTQFFMGNPHAFKRKQIEKRDIEKAQKLCERWPMHVFSHFPYIANLAGSVKNKTLAWDGDEEQDAKMLSLLKNIEYELSILANFRGKRSGVVIHPGSFPNKKAGIGAISKSINKINFMDNAKLLLENSAGKGTTLATTFQEIKEIYDGVDEDKKKHIGVCVDTAHICGVGDYDLSKCSEVDRMFEDFDRILGIEMFTLLHLNDSLIPLGGKDDRHGLLGQGYIWGEDNTSLKYLLDKCKKYGIPAMLETHGSDMLYLAAIS